MVSDPGAFVNAESRLEIGCPFVADQPSADFGSATTQV
jgi:hypothetical protein